MKLAILAFGALLGGFAASLSLPAGHGLGQAVCATMPGGVVQLFNCLP